MVSKITITEREKGKGSWLRSYLMNISNKPKITRKSQKAKIYLLHSQAQLGLVLPSQIQLLALELDEEWHALSADIVEKWKDSRTKLLLKDLPRQLQSGKMTRLWPSSSAWFRLMNRFWSDLTKTRRERKGIISVLSLASSGAQSLKNFLKREDCSWVFFLLQYTVEKIDRILIYGFFC